MNLKEAFRYQKFYDVLMEKGETILQTERYITTTVETHLNSKVKADATDVVTVASDDNPYQEKINAIVDLMLALIEEKEKLYLRIAEAKKQLPFDMDSAVAINIKRQSLSTVLNMMSQKKPHEKILRGHGIGYSFNAEGNQIQYRCDLKSVTSIGFDRNKVRTEAKKLSCASDQTSSALDRAIVSTQVEYTAPFDVNDTFDEVLEAFISSR